MYTDLHLHTTASDGINTPTEVVALAKNKGFSAIAITDHDTTAGIEEALIAGDKSQLEVIPGIELSTLMGNREIHILGYYLDWKNSLLEEKLIQLIDSRQNRAEKMVKKLNNSGVDISINRVKKIAAADFIGRPHIAQALLEKGYINDISEAFSEEYIGRGGRAYVERFNLSPAEGIDLLKQAGAIPVLAHPGFLSQGPPLTEQEIAVLVKDGIKGIEPYYSKHTKEQEEKYLYIGNKYNLLITGGSDCHGQKDSDNHLRKIKLPYKFVEALKNEKAKIKER